VAIYSIKDLEKLSGIKAHTIRVWEQRYDIINPERTPTNIRYYKDEDLKFLLNIALLNKNGIKISKIAKMSKSEIAEKVAAISEINFEYGTQLDALTISMIEMDEYKFDRIISTNIQQIGFERTMLEVIHPFLDKLGVLWLTGSINPVQEKLHQLSDTPKIDRSDR
jgi:DNA-binding transcriptional MerR regulator